MSLDNFHNFIASKRISGMSCADIAHDLATEFGEMRGFSARNICRRCQQQGLRKDVCSDDQLQAAVAQGIVEVGGRRETKPQSCLKY